MEKQPSPWKKGAFFLCEKCGRRDDGDASLKDTAEDWKKEFKSRFRDAGHGKDIRVMVSGCLSLCPPGKQVGVWCAADGKTEAVICQAGEKETVFAWLKEKL